MYPEGDSSSEEHASCGSAERGGGFGSDVYKGGG